MVHEFVIETGMSANALGRAAVGDGGCIGGLRNGRNIGIDTMDRLMDYMHAERIRRAEPGARCATACQEGAEGHYPHDAQREIALHPLARLAARLRRLLGREPETPPGGQTRSDAPTTCAAGRHEQPEGPNT